MATYYVRKTGNNSNDGLSPATAWATISKAAGASGISSGDTVYIGGGVYREKVTFALTNPVAETFFIGDPTGEFTGDAGEVRITNYLTNDITAPTNQPVIDLNGRNHLTFEGIYFQQALTGSPAFHEADMIQSLSTISQYITFRKCAISCDHLDGQYNNEIIYVKGEANTPFHWIIDRCIINGNGAFGNGIIFDGFGLVHSGDFDADVVIKNSLIIGSSWQIRWPAEGNMGGLQIIGCDISLVQVSIRTQNGTTTNATILGNVFRGGGVGSYAIEASDSNISAVVENFNRFVCPTGEDVNNVTHGVDSVYGADHAFLFYFGQESLWGQQPQPYLMPTSGSPLLGFWTGSPANDLLDAIRPNPAAVGAMEYQSYECAESSGGSAGMSMGGGLNYG